MLSILFILTIYYEHMLAQTTDSGSNKNTMAKSMYEKLKLHSDITFDWDPDTMHIRFFYHKLALIVNSGVNELGLYAPPPEKVKDSILGNFPIPNSMYPIEEEDDKSDLENNEQTDIQIDSTLDEDASSEVSEEETDYDEDSNTKTS